MGAAIEGGAWLTAVVLVFLVRKRRASFLFALGGAACVVAAHVMWWLFVFPVNNQMLHWTPQQLPADFSALRMQWEYAHGARAVLQILGLAALVLSILVETAPKTAASGASGARL